MDFISFFGNTGPARAYRLSPGRARGTACRLRAEFLNGEIFYILKEAQVLIESWRHHYNAARPHSQHGGEVVNALTFKLDPSTGAGQDKLPHLLNVAGIRISGIYCQQITVGKPLRAG